VSRRRRQLTEHEEATIAAFVLPARRDRERLLLARGDVDAGMWAHRPPLDSAAMKRLPRQWSADDLLADLKRRGAPDVAVGVYGRLAGQAVPLTAAVRTVFGAQYGDLISLVPGRLAYYDGEWKNGSYVLSR
jgi:hypothetical protein